jgi:hypothetical protein
MSDDPATTYNLPKGVYRSAVVASTGSYRPAVKSILVLQQSTFVATLLGGQKLNYGTVPTPPCGVPFVRSLRVRSAPSTGARATVQCRDGPKLGPL